MLSKSVVASIALSLLPSLASGQETLTFEVASSRDFGTNIDDDEDEGILNGPFDDLRFFPAQFLESSVGGGGPSGNPLVSSLEGSMFIQNGEIFDEGTNTIDTDGSIGNQIPFTADRVDFYNSKCTAVKGTLIPVQVEQNICDYNFCFGDDCIFGRSGGDFSLDPSEESADAVPPVSVQIIGGTGIYEMASGNGLITQAAVPADNFLDESLLFVTLNLN
jgi:hypothetical protein